MKTKETKLKTLKDLDLMSMPQIEVKNVLRQEAIELILRYWKEPHLFTIFDFMNFFNITEKDLASSNEGNGLNPSSNSRNGIKEND
jgi:hypothetical protein